MITIAYILKTEFLINTKVQKIRDMSFKYHYTSALSWFQHSDSSSELVHPLPECMVLFF